MWVAGDFAQLRERLAVGLRDVENVRGPETKAAVGVALIGFVRVLPVVAVPQEHRGDDGDALLALADLPAESLPRLVAGDPRGVGALRQDQHDVAEAVLVEAGHGPQERRERVAAARVQGGLQFIECLCGELFGLVCWFHISSSSVCDVLFLRD